MAMARCAFAFSPARKAAYEILIQPQSRPNQAPLRHHGTDGQMRGRYSRDAVLQKIARRAAQHHLDQSRSTRNRLLSCAFKIRNVTAN